MKTRVRKESFEGILIYIEYFGWPQAHVTTCRISHHDTHLATWLHGDPRGSVDREHNTYLTPYAPEDSKRLAHRDWLCNSGTFLFQEQHRPMVRGTMLDVAEHNRWTIHEINVRSNHVHVVVGADAPPERVMNALKSWTTRRLREARLVTSEQKIWSRHGSTKYLWNESDLKAACKYVLDGQGADI